jgi:hypothetical protein
MAVLRACELRWVELCEAQCEACVPGILRGGAIPPRFQLPSAIRSMFMQKKIEFVVSKRNTII